MALLIMISQFCTLLLAHLSRDANVTGTKLFEHAFSFSSLSLSQIAKEEINRCTIVKEQ